MYDFPEIKKFTLYKDFYITTTDNKTTLNESNYLTRSTI